VAAVLIAWVAEAPDEVYRRIDTVASLFPVDS